jgi:hypothetical protein
MSEPPKTTQEQNGIPLQFSIISLVQKPGDTQQTPVEE